MLGDHAAPLIGVEVLEMQPLRVGAIGQDDGVFAVANGPVDVGAQDEAVVQGDGDVPVDAHPVAHFALELAHEDSLTAVGPASLYHSPSRRIKSAAITRGSEP